MNKTTWTVRLNLSVLINPFRHSGEQSAVEIAMSSKAVCTVDLGRRHLFQRGQTYSRINE